MFRCICIVRCGESICDGPRGFSWPTPISARLLQFNRVAPLRAAPLQIYCTSLWISFFNGQGFVSSRAPLIRRCSLARQGSPPTFFFFFFYLLLLGFLRIFFRFFFSFYMKGKETNWSLAPSRAKLIIQPYEQCCRLGAYLQLVYPEQR